MPKTSWHLKGRYLVRCGTYKTYTAAAAPHIKTVQKRKETRNMEFLKEVLGEELYGKVESAVKAFNEKPENKDRQVKAANLATGEYVGKAKYDSIEAEKKNLESQIATLNSTISSLKESNKDNEALQGTIKKLQEDLKLQQAQNVKTAQMYALKEQLGKSGVVDPDYLIYRHGGVEKFNFDKENRPIGVEDVLKPYREDTALGHLFKKEEKPPYSPAGGGVPAVNPFKADTYNMTEQAKLFRSNPEQARALAAAAGVTI